MKGARFLVIAPPDRSRTACVRNRGGKTLDGYPADWISVGMTNREPEPHERWCFEGECWRECPVAAAEIAARREPTIRELMVRIEALEAAVEDLKSKRSKGDLQ